MDSLEHWVRWGGYLLLVGIIFAETGLLVGFFLPGDSLLFAAGIVAAQGYLDIRAVILLLIVAGVLGNSAGYWFGRKAGQPLFQRPNSKLFKKEYLERAKAFYDQHGGVAIVLARFVPIVRTFAPIVAGAIEMPYARFTLYNLLGSAGWITSCCLAGYFLGNVPVIKKHIELMILAIVAVSVLPIILHSLKEQRKGH
ncbi:MAG TPA: VTT domain-containing protein [Armatimonadota bacterium]|jgi:membrane-associated protein